MSTNSTSRERRDWTLIIFLLPIGIVLMLIAGQIAIRLVPSWSVDAGMQSSLDPETAAKSQPGQVQPISFDILTPMGWLESFLTPGPGSASDGVVFPPFIILEPSITPSITPTATDTPVSPTVSPTTVTPTATTPSPTKKPDDDTPTATPTTPTPALCMDPGADNYLGPLPCTYTPTTCTDPLANNNGGPLPCVYPTSSPLVGSSTSVPGNTNVGAPDGAIGGVPDGYFIVVNLSATPIVVTDPSETNYDFVYYELPAGTGINLDSVILSISMDNVTYYVVFNWGDDIPDNNSNVGDVASSTGTENDNQNIDDSELHGTSPQDTGILVDVDNAPSNPPPGSYQYLAIQAPVAPTADGNDGVDVDAIQVTEVAP